VAVLILVLVGCGSIIGAAYLNIGAKEAASSITINLIVKKIKVHFLIDEFSLCCLN
jgi:hypothetical protein